MLTAWRVCRFVPCSIGANHCRLRHIGWEKCVHGLTSRPRESASEPFLGELLRLFDYPPGSARALLLALPFGRVLLVLLVQEVVAEDVDRGVHWVGGSGPGTERNST